MVLIIVGVLIAIIVGLMIYNVKLFNRIKVFNSMEERFTGLSIVQEFMNIVGEESTINDKLNKINDLIIEKYDIKYSSIVVFDGSEYVIKASNVEERLWDNMKNLHNEEIFKDSITSYIPKYITVNNDTERLPYQKSELIRAKSAMFFPLYIDNVYIGYWIIESSVPHAFDKIDTMILEVVRDNIVAVLKTVSYQNIIETIVRKDEFTKLPSAEYLYGAAKRIIDQHTISALCMFRISNIEEINEEYGRKTGNETIIQVANKIRDSIAKDYIFVRYMGPKFVIVFSGVKKDDVVEYIEDLKKDTEELEIEEVIDDDENQEVRYIKPTLNFVISTYYKGTGMESVLKKMEEFLDNAEKSESDISYI